MMSDEDRQTGRAWIACALENVDPMNRRGFVHGMLVALEAIPRVLHPKDVALEWLLETNDGGGMDYVLESLALHCGIDFPDAAQVLAERDRYVGRTKDLEARLSGIVLVAQGRKAPGVEAES